MRTKHVIVEDYNPNWLTEFNKIKSELQTALKEKVISIEHIGSTSVFNLSAKPIIDIDIVIDNNFLEVKSILENLDYTHEGHLGIIGREAFKYSHKPHLMKHHLYVCHKDSIELKKHITFRNYLRTHPDDVKAYSDLKKALASKFPHDIDAYMLGKTSLIEDLYKKAGLS